jgi:hypothetical protein
MGIYAYRIIWHISPPFDISPPKKPSIRPHGPHRGGLYARLYGTNITQTRGFCLRDLYEPIRQHTDPKQGDFSSCVIITYGTKLSICMGFFGKVVHTERVSTATHLASAVIPTFDGSKHATPWALYIMDELQDDTHVRDTNWSGSMSDLTEALEAARDEYTQRNPRSLALFKSSLSHMPGGNTRSVIHALPFPLSIKRGEGTILADVDEHLYIDFLSEYSAGLYGHSCEPIKMAIIQALDKGWNYGGKNTYEGVLSQILVERFDSMDMIRFCNSGTEANLMALGAAINFTGKKKV